MGVGIAAEPIGDPGDDALLEQPDGALAQHAMSVVFAREGSLRSLQNTRLGLGGAVALRSLIGRESALHAAGFANA
jgi:hypothetical protein